jgi:MFS family permease
VKPWSLVGLLAATATASYLARVNVSVAGALMLLLGFRLLLGIGEAPTFPAAAQAISRYIPTEARGRANGLVIAAIGLGSAIAPPLVGYVMVRYGWRAALAVSGLPALAVAIAWMAVKRMPPEVGAVTARADDAPGGTDPAAGTAAAADERGRLGTRSFVLLTASYTLQGYVGYIFDGARPERGGPVLGDDDRTRGAEELRRRRPPLARRFAAAGRGLGTATASPP